LFTNNHRISVNSVKTTRPKGQSTETTGGSLSAKVADLDRRVDRIELRMDRMEAGIGQILDLVKKDKATAPTTRKP